MIRPAFATLGVGIVVSAASAQGCGASGVGDPCIPEQEWSTAFSGFDPQEVNIESTSFQCLTRVCLANHFRGRVTCPYGQDQAGNLPCVDGASCGPNPVGPCMTPDGRMMPIAVHPQCVDRPAADAVYCSCRCANANGQTNEWRLLRMPIGLRVQPARHAHRHPPSESHRRVLRQEGHRVPARELLRAGLRSHHRHAKLRTTVNPVISSSSTPTPRQDRNPGRASPASGSLLRGRSAGSRGCVSRCSSVRASRR
jgi:hypothetical protein